MSRGEPLKPEEWRDMLDGAGRVISVKRLHEKIFRGVSDNYQN